MRFSKQANKLIKAGKTPKQIRAALVRAGAAPCVAQEWANEPLRRAAILERKLKRQGRSRGRVVFSKVTTDPESGYRYEHGLHATKGYFSRRVVV